MKQSLFSLQKYKLTPLPSHLPNFGPEEIYINFELMEVCSRRSSPPHIANYLLKYHSWLVGMFLHKSLTIYRSGKETEKVKWENLFLETTDDCSGFNKQQYTLTKIIFDLRGCAVPLTSSVSM